MIDQSGSMKGDTLTSKGILRSLRNTEVLVLGLDLEAEGIG
jgi:hypothetical protein